MHLRKSVHSLIISFVSLMLVPRALALDVQLFEPVPWVSKGVNVWGTDTLSKRAFEFGVYVDWPRNVIEFGTLNNVKIDDILKNFVAFDFQFAYGITDRLMFSSDIPFYPFYQLEPIGSITQKTGATVGDLRLNTVWQLMSRGNKRYWNWGLAVVPFLTVPVGTEDKFVGNKNVMGGLRFIADQDLTSKDYLKLNLGFRFRETEQILNLRINHEIFGSVGYNRKVWEEENLELFAELFGSTTTGHFLSQEISSPLELDVGARKSWLDGKLQTVLGVGRGLNNGYGAPDFRLFAGATVAIGKKYQEMPTGQLVITIREENGSPHSGKIQLKSMDDSPYSHEVVSDRTDERLKSGKYFFSVDVDGYFREVGRVVIAPKQTTRVEIILRPQLGGKIEAVGQVLFDLDQATIKEESHPVLRGIIDILNRYPEIAKLQIGAHTDSLASDKYNFDLSDRRAKSVVDYLISQGIKAERLTSQGFGESKPLATNATKEGRAKNRRVEFVILEILTDNVEVKEYGPTELYNIER